jgi:translocator protein
MAIIRGSTAGAGSTRSVDHHDDWVRIAFAGLAIGLVAVYAVLSGRWVGTDATWYRSLEQPWWQPPPIVFGVIWPYNFVALIVVGVALALGASTTRTTVFLGFLAASVALALVWAYQFYVPHNLTLAAWALSAAALLTIPLVILAFSERIWMGVVLLPYQIWLVIAASLSWGYVVLD